jgi:formylmethanofuran dehydrogenase subunit B
MQAEEMDVLRAATVDLIDAVAREAIMWGCNPLKLWPQITTRLAASARTCTTPAEFSHRMLRAMRVASPGLAVAKAADRLVTLVGPGHAETDAWLTMVERETSYLVAAVRIRREEKKAKRKAQQETKSAGEPAEMQTQLWNR